MPFDARFNHLFRMAARKPISEFKQSAHVGKEPEAVHDPGTGKTWKMSSELHAKVVGGFCLGASLDWLRKVLQNQNKAVAHVKMSRVTRMAQTHDRLDDLMKRDMPLVAAMRKKSDEMRSTAAGVVQSARSAHAAFQADVAKWIEANGGSWNDGDASISGSPQVLAMFSEKMAQLDDMTEAINKKITSQKEVSGQANALWDEANQLVMSSSSAERRADLWDVIANELGTDGGKKRKYSGILPLASGPKEKYATFKDYLVAMLSAQGFSAGRGMLLSLSLVPGPGHAIALHRESATKTILFDANLGVFKFEDVSLLVHALVILAELGYAGRDPDGKVTTLGNDHGWQIFCKTESVLPARGEERIATAEDAMRAYDSARDTIEFSAEIARELMMDSLREAKRMAGIYEADKTPENQRAWVAAHNEANRAVSLASGDRNMARTMYPGFTGEGITLVPAGKK